MTIPTLLYEDFKITWDANEPIFIDLYNRDEMSLNTLIIRLVDYNDELVPVKADLCDLTILID